MFDNSCERTLCTVRRHLWAVAAKDDVLKERSESEAQRRARAALPRRRVRRPSIWALPPRGPNAVICSPSRLRRRCRGAEATDNNDSQHCRRCRPIARPQTVGVDADHAPGRELVDETGLDALRDNEAAAATIGDGAGAATTKGAGRHQRKQRHRLLLSHVADGHAQSVGGAGGKREPHERNLVAEQRGGFKHAKADGGKGGTRSCEDAVDGAKAKRAPQQEAVRVPTSLMTTSTNASFSLLSSSSSSLGSTMTASFITASTSASSKNRRGPGGEALPPLTALSACDLMMVRLALATTTMPETAK